MEKKLYETPELTTIQFSVEDIVTTSLTSLKLNDGEEGKIRSKFNWENLGL